MVWVYQVDGEFAQDAAIPAECIIGGWPIDRDGRVCGPYVANPYHAPRTDCSPPDPAWPKA